MNRSAFLTGTVCSLPVFCSEEWQMWRLVLLTQASLGTEPFTKRARQTQHTGNREAMLLVANDIACVFREHEITGYLPLKKDRRDRDQWDSICCQWTSPILWGNKMKHTIVLQTELSISHELIPWDQYGKKHYIERMVGVCYLDNSASQTPCWQHDKEMRLTLEEVAKIEARSVVIDLLQLCVGEHAEDLIVSIGQLVGQLQKQSKKRKWHESNERHVHQSKK